MVLRYNQDINIQRQNLKIQDHDTVRALSQFDPLLFSKGSYGGSVEKSLGTSDSVFSLFSLESDTIETEKLEVILGVRKKIVTGTTVDFTFDFTKTRTIGGDSFSSLLGGTGATTLNPTYESKLSLKITQPLLRNFGISYNTADIRLSYCNTRIASHQVEDSIRKSVGEALFSYWDLVFAYLDKEVKQKSMDLANELHQNNKILYKVGRATMVDVLQAEVNVMDFRRQLIAADQKIQDAEDKLKTMIFPPIESFKRDVKLIPVEKPDYQVQETDLDSACAIALKQRPDYLQILQKIEMARIEVDKAKNQLLPKLDFEGQAGLTGRDDGFENSIDNMFSGESYFWQIGLALEVPLGNRYARSSYQKTLDQLKQAEMEKSKIEMSIELEIRTLIRSLLTAYEQIKVATKAREVAERQLNEAQIRVKVGEAVPRRILEAQEDLTESRTQELQAIIAYKKAIIALEEAKGTLLPYFHWGK